MMSMIRTIYTQSKATLREGQSLFWLFIYPVLLVVIFHFAFGGLADAKMEAIPVGLEPKLLHEKIFQQIPILKISVMDQKEAKAAFDAGEIKAYIDQDLGLMVERMDSEAEVVQGIVRSVKQSMAYGLKGLSVDPQKNYVDSSAKTPSFAYFYQSIILVYFMLNGTYGGSFAAINNLPNRSHLGLRQSISPKPKFWMISASAISAFLLQILVVFMLLFLSEGILKQELVQNWPITLSVGILGNFWSVSYGLLFCLIIKSSETATTGIMTVTSFILGGSAGMFYSGLKGVIDRFLPFFNKINPIALAHEAFSMGNSYGFVPFVQSRLLILAAIAMANLVIASIILRRRRYAHL